MKFYQCKTCGNIMVLFEDAGVTPICCGSPMSDLTPLVEDDGKEKHVPVVSINDNVVTIKVGDVAHPMSDEHYIKWIMLETNLGEYKRYLKPGMEPIVTFTLAKDEHPIKAYEYCSIHSLWSKQV